MMNQEQNQSSRPRRRRSAEAIAEEHQLLERARSGDSDAFSKLIDAYYPRAFAVALGMVRSREDAEDVVQEAFIRVHRRLTDFRAASGFYTWLYRIVVNLSIDSIRKQRRERRTDIEDEAAREAIGNGERLWPTVDQDNPFASTHHGELRKRINQAFDQLSDIHQAVLMLREVEGLSYEEISETVGIKKGTVMSRLFHARKAMQQQLLERFGDVTAAWTFSPAY